MHLTNAWSGRDVKSGARHGRATLSCAHVAQSASSAGRSSSSLDVGMRTLSIQFQPLRAPGLTSRRVASVLADLAASVLSVRAFSFRGGNDRGPYINYFFETRSPVKTWNAVSMSALKHRGIGAQLRRSTIITCEGTRGWDNYLLLHHFNPKVELDRMPTSNNRRRGRESR